MDYNYLRKKSIFKDHSVVVVLTQSVATAVGAEGGSSRGELGPSGPEPPRHWGRLPPPDAV